MGRANMNKAFLLCLALCVVAALAAPQTKKTPGRKPLSSGGATPGRRLLTTNGINSAITSISPTYGPLEGNTLIMMVGTAGTFSDHAMKCKFGSGTTTTATYITSTHASCRSPKMSTGSKAFVGVNTGGTDVACGTACTFTFF